MHEMFIKRDEYRTVWHVDVDSADELLGEFADEAPGEEPEAEEVESDEEQDVAFLNNGERLVLHSVDLHFSNSLRKRIWLEQRTWTLPPKQNYSSTVLQVVCLELDSHQMHQNSHKLSTSQEFLINGQRLARDFMLMEK